MMSSSHTLWVVLPTKASRPPFAARKERRPLRVMPRVGKGTGEFSLLPLPLGIGKGNDGTAAFELQEEEEDEEDDDIILRSCSKPLQPRLLWELRPGGGVRVWQLAALKNTKTKTKGNQKQRPNTGAKRETRGRETPPEPNPTQCGIKRNTNQSMCELLRADKWNTTI